MGGFWLRGGFGRRGGASQGEDAAAGCDEDAVMNGKEDDLIPL